MWKSFRIIILLLILVVVAVNAWRDQNQDWNRPIIVLLHPINADGRETTQSYIRALGLQQFSEIQQFLMQQHNHYRERPLQLYVQFGRELQQPPPQVPEQQSWFQVVLWSLKFRFYAWQQHQSVDGRPALTLYLNYYDPQIMKALKHSTALERGRIGSVNLFASDHQARQNNVVIAHELLHGFGASDKYDLVTGQPIYPIGYAEPDKQPLLPQKYAEIMGGHIPLSTSHAKMPNHLNETLLSPLTAREIGWLP